MRAFFSYCSIFPYQRLNLTSHQITNQWISIFFIWLMCHLVSYMFYIRCSIMDKVHIFFSVIDEETHQELQQLANLH